MSDEDDLMQAMIGGQQQTPDQNLAIADALRRKGVTAAMLTASNAPGLSQLGADLNSQYNNETAQLGRQAQKNDSENIQRDQFGRLMSKEEDRNAYQDRQLTQLREIADQENQTRRDIGLGKQNAAMLTSADQNMIDGIKSYNAPLPTSRSPRNLAIIDAVFDQMPDYDNTKYGEKQKAAKDFGSGAKGDLVRSADVSLQHLDLADSLGQGLSNTRFPLVNSVVNWAKTQYGSSDVKNFNAAKSIVSDEVNKFILGSGGALADRKALQDQLDAANSPEALKGVTDTLRTLMGGQIHGLKQQYTNAGLKNFDDMLSPHALTVLGLNTTKPTDVSGSVARYTSGNGGPDLPQSSLALHGSLSALSGQGTGASDDQGNPMTSALPRSVQGLGGSQGLPATGVAAPLGPGAPAAPTGQGGPIPVRSMPRPVPGPGGQIVKVKTVNGVTWALMADGTEKRLER